VFVEYLLLSLITCCVLKGEDYKTGAYRDKTGAVVALKYFKQLAVWLFVVTGMKIATLALVLRSTHYFAIAATFILEPVNRHAVSKLLAVVIVTPVCMNALQFWVVDNILKKGKKEKSYGLAHLEEGLLDPLDPLSMTAALAEKDDLLAQRQEALIETQVVSEQRFNKLAEHFARQQEEIVEQKKQLIAAQGAVINLKMRLLASEDEQIIKQQQQLLSARQQQQQQEKHEASTYPSSRRHSTSQPEQEHAEQVEQQQEGQQEEAYEEYENSGKTPRSRKGHSEKVGEDDSSPEHGEHSEPESQGELDPASAEEEERAEDVAIRATIKKLATATIMLKYCGNNMRKNSQEQLTPHQTPRMKDQQLSSCGHTPRMHPNSCGHTPRMNVSSCGHTPRGWSPGDAEFTPRQADAEFFCLTPERGEPEEEAIPDGPEAVVAALPVLSKRCPRARITA
jgi:hypothetical protein